MSDLLIEDMTGTFLSQQIKSTANSIVTAIRPHIYIEGSPAGSLRVDIYDSTDTTQLATGTAVSIASMKAQTYAHGYFRLNIDYGLSENTVYTVRLVGVGYTYNASNYVSWCKDFDTQKYTRNYTPSIGFNSAFDMEIWVLNDNVRGL